MVNDADEIAALAERVTHRLLSIDGIDLRASAAAEELGKLPPDNARLLLGRIARGAVRSARFAEALVTVVDALQMGLVPAPHLEAIAEAAEGAGDDAVRRLVAKEPPPRRAYDPADEVFSDAKMSSLTLGHRRALARAHDPDLLSRLSHDQDPRVVRNLLANPRMTEREVLRIAARRPARPEVLEEVLTSAKWSRNSRVRRALAQNPYSPISLSVRALSTLLSAELREIERDLNLHPEVRDAAKKLREARRGREEAPRGDQEPGEGG